MKYPVIAAFLLMMLSAPLFAQADYIKHKVLKKETVADIAKKYKVTPYDIYRLNPDSKNGIKENSILLVPKHSKPAPSEPVKEKTTKVANTTHEVQAGETLYSIAKKYNVSFDDIKKANEGNAGDALKIGQKIIIPVKGSAVAAQVKEAKKAEAKTPPPSYFYHTVAAGETKYSIAKQYGMTLQVLEALNPEAKDTLAIGQKLKLDKNAVIAKETQPEPVAANVPDFVQEMYVNYQVKPKETLYSLAKNARMTEEELMVLNPELRDGVKEGMIIKMRVGAGTGAKTVADLSKTLKKSSAKEIAILLPFNLPKAESDTARTNRLRKDRFLNMTLDFYAGALMAIDSAKALGLPVKVRIYDSKETRTSSDVASLKGSLSSASAVIGPFFQGNAETAAATLGTVPVISPLSKESGKAYSNLFQSVPSEETVKTAMLEYLKSKDANVVAVVDSKKASSRQLIKKNYPEAKFLDGGITDASMRAQLSKDKMNYVIMETENLSMILNTTKVLAGALTDYRIQLVVLETTDKLEHDEVPLSRLTALKMLYPSVTNDSETPATALFGKVFRQKNGVNPSQFATRGFDVTFDVILRLFQEESFTDVINAKATEYVENKFAYEAINGGNYNNGVYILQYDEDLTIKQAQ
jgi:LysM repeat protein